MGLCTSKTSVSLNPAAHILHAEREDHDSPEGTPILEEGVLLVQPAKNKTEGGTKGGRGGGTQPAKGYMELGGKEGEAQMSREGGEEEEEEEEQDAVEEMVNFSHSEVSLQSEFLELS
uniref:Uncharacterized protein n=1 Tax=Knipowitschia caucasica TaxID=637954 RepID=A0AAV2MLI4_KNICA